MKRSLDNCLNCNEKITIWYKVRAFWPRTSWRLICPRCGQEYAVSPKTRRVLDLLTIALLVVMTFLAFYILPKIEDFFQSRDSPFLLRMIINLLLVILVSFIICAIVAKFAGFENVR